MKRFDSIDSIREHFKIFLDEPNKIKKELQKRLIEVHPDKNGGTPKSKEDEQIVIEINSAIDFIKGFLNNPNHALVSANEFSELIKVINNTTIEQKSEAQLVRLESKLETSLSKGVAYKFIIPKIGLTSVSVIFSFLWLFPETITKHPMLSKFFEPGSNNFELLTVLWFISIITCSYLWTFAYYDSIKDKRLKEDLKLESIQNDLFSAFTRQRVEEPNNSKFQKYELVEFVRIVCRSADSLQSALYHNQIKFSYKRIVENSIFKTRLDNDSVQRLVDLLIERALKKGVIALVDTKSMNDSYKIL